MNSQLSGRNQRREEMMQGIQFASLVVFCILLVYRITDLYRHDQVSDQRSYNKFSQKHVILGRKSNLGWFSQTSSSYVENVIFLDTTGNSLAKFQEEKSQNLERQQKDVHEDTDGTVIAGSGKEIEGKNSDPMFDVTVFYDENGVPPGIIDINVNKIYE